MRDGLLQVLIEEGLRICPVLLGVGGVNLTHQHVQSGALQAHLVRIPARIAALVVVVLQQARVYEQHLLYKVHSQELHDSASLCGLSLLRLSIMLPLLRPVVA